MTDDQLIKIRHLLGMRKQELKKDWLYESARILLEEVERLRGEPEERER